jgi:Zn-dependent peptidase ImmA (M78 family)
MSTVLQDVSFLTRQEIEQRAVNVLREYRLESIPVNPVVLVGRLGISAHNAKFFDNNIVGIIEKRSDQVTLLVKRTASPFRKCFTLAHGLGHFFLHLPGDGTFVDKEVNLFRQPQEDQNDITPERRREIQANLFATALLMPAEAVRAEWKALPSINALARRFNVSEAAMGMRIAQLGLE